MEVLPVPHEVPLIVRLPELELTKDDQIQTPDAASDPLAALPVMLT